MILKRHSKIAPAAIGSMAINSAQQVLYSNYIQHPISHIKTFDLHMGNTSPHSTACKSLFLINSRLIDQPISIPQIGA